MNEILITEDSFQKQCCEACICEIIHSSTPPVPDDEL
jgi:hypothetical protein